MSETIFNSNYAYDPSLKVKNTFITIQDEELQSNNTELNTTKNEDEHRKKEKKRSMFKWKKSNTSEVLLTNVIVETTSEDKLKNSFEPVHNEISTPRSTIGLPNRDKVHREENDHLFTAPPVSISESNVFSNQFHSSDPDSSLPGGSVEDSDVPTENRKSRRFSMTNFMNTHKGVSLNDWMKKVRRHYRSKTTAADDKEETEELHVDTPLSPIEEEIQDKIGLITPSNFSSTQANAGDILSSEEAESEPLKVPETPSATNRFFRALVKGSSRKKSRDEVIYDEKLKDIPEEKEDNSSAQLNIKPKKKQRECKKIRRSQRGISEESTNTTTDASVSAFGASRQNSHAPSDTDSPQTIFAWIDDSAFKSQQDVIDFKERLFDIFELAAPVKCYKNGTNAIRAFRKKYVSPVKMSHVVPTGDTRQFDLKTPPADWGDLAETTPPPEGNSNLDLTPQNTLVVIVCPSFAQKIVEFFEETHLRNVKVVIAIYSFYPDRIKYLLSSNRSRAMEAIDSEFVVCLSGDSNKVIKAIRDSL